MNFEESIYSLSTFLTDNNFAVVEKSPHFIKYASNLTTITIAYANLEHVFYIYVGENSKSLIELTPLVIKEIFKDNSFQFQTTLSIDNLISFLKTTGKPIVLGDKNIFKKLTEFSESQSKNYTKQITHLQNIQNADIAWSQKDYINFIKYIDMAEKDLLSESHLKKYKIANVKLQRQQ